MPQVSTARLIEIIDNIGPVGEGEAVVIAAELLARRGRREPMQISPLYAASDLRVTIAEPNGFSSMLVRHLRNELRQFIEDGASSPDPYEVERFIDWLERRTQ